MAPKERRSAWVVRGCSPGTQNHGRSDRRWAARTAACPCRAGCSRQTAPSKPHSRHDRAAHQHSPGATDALFIGASTEWKLGPSAEALVAQAKDRGKWVHMGRVNSHRRIRYAASIGCDSVDGTKWVRWRDAYLDSGLKLVGESVQLRLKTTATCGPPAPSMFARCACGGAGNGPHPAEPATERDEYSCPSRLSPA
jgi:hypothetical protein